MDGEGDLEADGYADAENDEENDENDEDDEEQDQEESQDSFGDAHSRDQTKNVAKPNASLLGSVSASAQGPGAPVSSRPTSHPNPTIMLTSPSPTQTSSATNGSTKQSLQARPEALTAPVYDIVPTIAAPHSTSINSITATPDLRWVFSGGADGYIRKFNWIETVNGKSMLTVAQRHPFVDSVTKAGVLMSYWENDDSQGQESLHKYDEM